MTSSLRAIPDEGYIELVGIDLIDEPVQAIRETMDEQALADLADSIATVGLINPLVLEKNGERYRVIAGHRRLIACQIIGHKTVRCIVRDRGQVDPVAVTLAENYYRETVNPVEEAEFLRRLLDERCHNDIELLAGLVKQKVSYIDDRLLLLRGDPAILESLRMQLISLAVARELNRVKHLETRRWLLDAALRGGATAALVRKWRADHDNPHTPEAAATVQTADGAAAAAAVNAAQLRCYFCDDTQNAHMMRAVWLHEYCERAFRKLLGIEGQAAANGG